MSEFERYERLMAEGGPYHGDEAEFLRRSQFLFSHLAGQSSPESATAALQAATETLDAPHSVPEPQTSHGRLYSEAQVREAAAFAVAELAKRSPAPPKGALIIAPQYADRWFVVQRKGGRVEIVTQGDGDAPGSADHTAPMVPLDEGCIYAAISPEQLADLIRAVRADGATVSEFGYDTDGRVASVSRRSAQ